MLRARPVVEVLAEDLWEFSMGFSLIRLPKHRESE